MSRIARYLAWRLLAATSLAVVAGRLAWAQQPAARQPVRADDAAAAQAKERLARQQALMRAREAARQQDDDRDDDADARQNELLARQQAVAQQRLSAYQQYFERLVFGSNGSVDEAALRAEYQAGFAREIDRLVRICGLTDSQKKNLLAAGRGDIKRFFDRLAEARGRLRVIDNPRMFVNETRRESQPLIEERTALAAGNGPILTKAIRHMLTEEQIARLKQDDDDRRAFRHRAAVRWTVVMLARSLGLSDDQRRRLETVLLAETRHPGKFGTFDYPIVMNQASLIPEAKLRPIFDDLQWRVLQREFAVARAQGRWLRAGGFVPFEMIGD